MNTIYNICLGILIIITLVSFSTNFDAIRTKRSNRGIKNKRLKRQMRNPAQSQPSTALRMSINNDNFSSKGHKTVYHSNTNVPSL